MSDFADLRRRAAQQAGTGNYWAGKVVALIDRLDRVGPSIHQMWKDHQCQRPDLEAIVRDLAEVGEYEIWDGEYSWCNLCNEAPHADECPWRRAVEWVRAQEGT